MRKELPKILRVLIDTREKNPLRFPRHFRFWNGGRQPHILRVDTEHRKLKTADYALDGFEAVSLGERKGGSEELWSNFVGASSARFGGVLYRMAQETKHPFILVDAPASQILKPRPYCPEPEKLLDVMFRSCQRYGVRLYWIPTPSSPKNATASGGIMLRLLWNAIYQEMYANERGIYRTPDSSHVRPERHQTLVAGSGGPSDPGPSEQSADVPDVSSQVPVV